ncbi:TPA: hypothetical protein IAA87_03470, partial [Candidatus Avigastranaerophilus faecigallinarum]|nr:hypothetical protein [Candidatus Avigastranaerophilus faecigallinarum]
MKKNILLFFFIITIIIVYSYSQTSNTYKVYKIKTPNQIFIDRNRNLIFDDTIPFHVSNIICINKDSDLNKFPILKNLTNNEKLFIEYKSKELANNLLTNKFISIKNNEIIIKNKKYSELLLNSKLVF